MNTPPGTDRLRIGESPAWIVLHVIAGVVGVPAVGALVDWQAPTWAARLTMAVLTVAVFASLAIHYRRHRDHMDAASFGYLRLALFFITLVGLLGWYVSLPLGIAFYLWVRRDEPRVMARAGDAPAWSPDQGDTHPAPRWIGPIAVVGAVGTVLATIWAETSDAGSAGTWTVTAVAAGSMVLLLGLSATATNRLRDADVQGLLMIAAVITVLALVTASVPIVLAAGGALAVWSIVELVRRRG